MSATRRMGFRQSRASNRGGGRGQGFRGGFSHKQYIPKDDIIAVMPILHYYADPRPYYEGDELPFFLYPKHRRDNGKGKRADFLVCSAGFMDTEEERKANWSGNDPCVGCHEMRKGGKDGNGDKSIDRRVFGAMPYVHLDWYHEVQVERNGEKLIYERGKRKGEPIMEKVVCGGDECKHCDAGDEPAFGATRYVELSKNFRDQMGDHEANISRACSSCREGVLETVALVCRKCGDLIIDCDGMNAKQVDKYASSFLKCEACSHEDIPLEEVECDNCGPKGRPTSLADVVLFLTKEGVGTNTSIVLRHPRNPSMPGWCFREKFRIPDLDGDDAKICTMENGELVYPEDIRKMMVPFNFAEMVGTSPEPPDKQAKRLGVANPYASKTSERDAPDNDGDGEFRGRRRRRRSRNQPDY